MYAITITKTMVEKPKFESRLEVMRVKPTFVAPYRKCRFFYLDPKDLKTKRSFTKHIEEIARNWPNGVYYLKMSSGKIFVRFEMYDGKVRKLYKDSPITGKEYPAWYFFK